MDIAIEKALEKDAYNYALCHISCWQSAYKNIIPSGYLLNMQAKKPLKNIKAF